MKPKKVITELTSGELLEKWIALLKTKPFQEAQLISEELFRRGLTVQTRMPKKGE